MAAPAPRNVAVLLLLLFPVLAPVASALPFVVLHGWSFSRLGWILIRFGVRSIPYPCMVAGCARGCVCRDWRRVRERWVGVLHQDAWGVVRLQRLLHVLIPPSLSGFADIVL